MKRSPLILLLLPWLSWATTTARIDKATVQQAILHTITDQTGSCSVVVSTSPTYAPLIDDVNTTLFAGSNLDSRPEAIVNGRDRQFVIGKRTAELIASGLNKNSRSLQTETVYYWQETCGTDMVASTFTTQTIRFGSTITDPRDDRNMPGTWAMPTQYPWTSTTTFVVDPYTGALMHRGSRVSDVDEASTTELFNVFATTLGGVGFTISGGSATYNGTSQNYLVLPSTPITDIWAGNDNRDLIYLRVNFTAKGTASSLDVCLTIDGQHCTGATINQAITSSFANYTVGSSTPILDSWRSGPYPPFWKRDARPQSGSLTVLADGKNIQTTGQTYFSLYMSSGSKMVINGSTVTVSSVTNQYNATIFPAQTPGTYNWSAQNLGFLIKDHAGTSDTFTVTGASYTIDLAGFGGGSAAGFSNLCSALKVTAGTGEKGTLCWALGIGRYLTNAPIYFWGDQGTVNMIGECGFAGQISGNTNGGACGSALWDVNNGNAWYVPYSTGPGTFFIARTVYTGDYSNVTGNLDSNMPSATTTPYGGEINAMVHSFDPTYVSTAYVTGWNAYTYQPYLSSGVIILQNSTLQQNYPSIIAIYDLNTQNIIADYHTFTGTPGMPNRWAGLHSIGAAFNNHFLIINHQDFMNIVPYTVTMTSNTLRGTYDTCPANTPNPELAGTQNCSLNVVLSSTIPLNSGSSFYNTYLSTGDYIVLQQSGSDVERMRILTISGSTVTVSRCLAPWNLSGSCADHTGASSLTIRPIISAYTGDVNWDWQADPHALGSVQPYGNSLQIAPVTADCHQIFGSVFSLVQCLQTQPDYTNSSQPVQVGSVPNFSTPVTWAGPYGQFGGQNQLVDQSTLSSHPSEAALNPWYYDTHALMGSQVLPTWSLKSGTTYIYWSSAVANVNNLDYRIVPYLGASGEKQIADFSGPGITLTDTSADNFKFCWALKAGDCWAGSGAGDLYVNLPQVALIGSKGGFLDESFPRDITFTQWRGPMVNVTQSVVPGSVSDPNSQWARPLSNPFMLPEVESNFQNGRQTVGAIWHTQNVSYMDGVKNGYVGTKIPSVQLDGKTRNTFMKVPISVGGVTGDQVRLKFGYTENGTKDQFYCWPRRSACYTDGSGTKPYLWSDETAQYTTCGSGCTIPLPVLPGRIAYYAVERKNAAGVIMTGPTQLATGE